MGRISSAMKKAMGFFGILVFLSLLFFLIFFFWDIDQKTVIEACPPPATATPQLMATAFLYPATDTQPNPSIYKKIAGPGCLYDTAKSFAVWLPKGWYGDSGLNVINITNYDPDSLQFQHGKALNKPADHIKIEIYVFEIDPEITVDQFISEEKERSYNTGFRYTFTENTPYKLGQYEGVTYDITNLADWNSRAITVRVNEIKAISLQLFPADSPAYENAINILSFMDASNNPK